MPKSKVKEGDFVILQNVPEPYNWQDGLIGKCTQMPGAFIGIAGAGNIHYFDLNDGEGGRYYDGSDYFRVPEQCRAVLQRKWNEQGKK